MKSYQFEISEKQLEALCDKYPNTGDFAIQIVELYFLDLDIGIEFRKGKNGADLVVIYAGGLEESFEVKGTKSTAISWQNFKVSSKACYDALVKGMTLIRVTNIGQCRMLLHFMKYGEDFNLIPEDRWAIKRINKPN